MEIKNQGISKVYLDFNATALVAPSVIAEVPHLLSAFGNASSIHWAGQASKTKVRESRKALAQELGVSPLELIFTSGASESNTTLVHGFLDLLQRNALPENFKTRNEFVTTTVEHPCLQKAFDHAEACGFTVHRLNVSKDGVLDLEQAAKVITEKTLLVSVMYANNETGSVFPIQALVDLAQKQGALVHSDMVQGLGKAQLNLNQIGVDYASFSGHKIGSLKGVGLLFVKKGRPFQTVIFGGGQERGRRGGTENVLGIASFGLVSDRIRNYCMHSEKIFSLRESFEESLLLNIPKIKIVGRGQSRIPNTSLILIDGVDGETLLMSLDLMGFAVSTGAACSSGNPEPSPVLLAMGYSRTEAQTSLRVSLGWETTADQLERFVGALTVVVNRLRSLNSRLVEASL